MDLQSREDQLLVSGLQAGQKQALEAVYRRYYAGLVGFATGFVKDRDLARDVVQDVFFRLWKNRSDLSDKLSIKSYLFRAVRNQSLNLLRDHPEWDTLPDDPLEENNADPDSDERYQLVRRAIDQLPPKTKQVFELSRFEGLTYAEIATHLGISEKTVENQMVRAFSKLREWLTVGLFLLLFG